MKRPNERGVSAVEFALVLPVLVLIIFGIVEFSLIIYDKALITNASREGARAGIMYATGNRPTKPEIEDFVKKYLREDPNDPNSDWRLITFTSGTAPIPKASGVCPDTLPAACLSDPDSASCPYITVDVKYDYKFLVLGSFGTKITLTASTTMKCE